METYKEKEYEVKNMIDNVDILSGTFESYVNEINDFIDNETKRYTELYTKYYFINQKLDNTQKEIKKIIYELEHNPRTNAETRDKYIMNKLKDLLETKGGNNEK